MMTDDAHPNGGVRIDTDGLSDNEGSNGAGLASLSSFLSPAMAAANGGISPTGSIGRSAGKSGRVIEKLMAENDRLRRELKSETAKREEEQRRAEAARSSRDSLQSINENLVHQTNIDKTSLSRKDRKIEELRSEREENIQRRLDAEANLRKYAADTDSKVASMSQELSAEISEKERYLRQYEVLSASWKNIDDSYKTSVNRLKKRIEEIAAEEKRNRTAVAKLEVTIEQQKQEIEKMSSARRKIEQAYNERIALTEVELQRMKDLTKGEHGEVAEILKEASDVAGQLKHLLGVQRAIRGIPDDEKLG